MTACERCSSPLWAGIKCSSCGRWCEGGLEEPLAEAAQIRATLKKDFDCPRCGHVCNSTKTLRVNTMSGGHFNYKQYDLGYIADAIEQFIRDNDSTEVDQYGSKKGRQFSNDTLNTFEQAIYFLKVAQIYAHRIDWLVSGDDSEESFHERLQEDLSK